MQLIRLPEVIEMTALSRSSIYRLMKKRDFPKSVKIGGRAVAWILEEIEKWLEERIAERDQQEPEEEEKKEEEQPVAA